MVHTGGHAGARADHPISHRKDGVKKSRSPQSDNQQREVYKWEWQFAQAYYDTQAPVEKLRKLVRLVCRAYKVPPPRLRFVRTNEKYCGMANDERIVLNGEWHGRSTPVLLHELAHYVCFQYGYYTNPHGPRFLGVYLWVLDNYEVLPLSASMPSARAAGLKFRDPLKSGPKTLKRYLVK